jgi:hypothetical protein
MSSRSTRTKRSREDDSTKDVSPKHQAVDRDGIPTSIASNKFKHDEEIVATEQNPSATPLPSPSQVSQSDDSITVTESMDTSVDDAGKNQSEVYFIDGEIGVIDDDDDDDDKEDDSDYVNETNDDDEDEEDDDDDDGDSDDDGVDEILRRMVERAEEAKEEQRIAAANAGVLDINKLSRKLHKLANQVASLSTSQQRSAKDERIIFTVAPQHLCDGIRQYIIPLKSITQEAFELLKRASGASSDDFHMTRHERIRLEVLLRIFEDNVTYEEEDNRCPVGYKDYFEELLRVWPSFEKGADPFLSKYLCSDREITTFTCVFSGMFHDTGSYNILHPM